MEFNSIQQQRAALDEKKISSVELTQHYCDRIEQFDPQLNCFITPTAEYALEQARNADARIARGEADSLNQV